MEDAPRKPQDIRLPAEAARRPQSASARPWGTAEETARTLQWETTVASVTGIDSIISILRDMVLLLLKLSYEDGHRLGY